MQRLARFALLIGVSAAPGAFAAPPFTAAEMIERGARLPDAALAVESLFALVELQNGDAAPNAAVTVSVCTGVPPGSVYAAVAVPPTTLALTGAPTTARPAVRTVNVTAPSFT